MRRTIKLTAAVAVVLLLAIVIKNIAFLNPFSNSANETTLEQLEQFHIKIDYVVDETDWDDSFFESFTDIQLEKAEECGDILIGTPTGNIYFNVGGIYQEVEVEEVIRGNCEYKTIWLHNGLTSTFEYDGDSVILKSMHRNLMQEDCRYLLFCNASAANEYSDRKVYREPDDMWFGCYNLTRDSDILLTEDNREYNPKIEFFTSSERILECYIAAKKKLIENYVRQP
jgi:hypothetical protein